MTQKNGIQVHYFAIFTISLTVLSVLMLSGCDTQGRGFALPPGNAEQGQLTFVALNCNSCHSVKDVLEQATEGKHPTVSVALGGTVTRVKTYGELVTSIINPSHKLSRGRDTSTLTKDGDTRMPSYNEVMSVQEMIDLTTFLQDSYDIYIPPYAAYYFP